MWPNGFDRIPQDESWVRSPVDKLALEYDTVQDHGWYRNLDPTLDDLQEIIHEGNIVIDYSAGTGIFVEHFLKRMPDLQAGYLLVDASPKFLRLALEKLGADERTAFRRIRFLKTEKRLQRLDEVLPESLRTRGVDALCSTNAIHLYYNISDTLLSWYRLLRPGAMALIQSGNIANPNAPENSWIIDDTVEKLQPIARELVRSEAKYAAFRPQLDDENRRIAYDQLRRKYFLPARPLSFYVDALCAASFEIVEVRERVMDAMVTDWGDFLTTYHEGVLGWAGGTAQIDGHAPSEETVTLRRQLLRESLAALFDGAPSFPTCWTYIKCRKGKENHAAVDSNR